MFCRDLEIDDLEKQLLVQGAISVDELSSLGKKEMLNLLLKHLQKQSFGKF